MFCGVVCYIFGFGGFVAGGLACRVWCLGFGCAIAFGYCVVCVRFDVLCD